MDAPENRTLALLVHLDLQRHGLLAVGAVHLALQPVVELMPVHMSAAAEYLLHPRKHICINDSFVGVLNDDLLLLRDATSFLGFVVDHLVLVVDHVPDVHRVMEYLSHRTGVPGSLFVSVLVQVRREPGVTLLCLIDGRVDDLLGFESLRNGWERFASKSKIEDHADNISDGFINNQMVVILRIYFIAVGRLCSNVHAPIRPLTFGGLDLARDVLGVHVVHDVLEGGYVIVAALGVDAIVNGDVTDAHPAEVDVREVAGHDVIPAQTTEILGDDQINHASLDVVDKAQKVRPIIGKTRKAIVDIVVNDGQLIFLTEAGEHEALRLYTGALADLLVVFAQAAVESCAVGGSCECDRESTSFQNE